MLKTQHPSSSIDIETFKLLFADTRGALANLYNRQFEIMKWNITTEFALLGFYLYKRQDLHNANLIFFVGFLALIFTAVWLLFVIQQTTQTMRSRIIELVTIAGEDFQKTYFAVMYKENPALFGEPWGPLNFSEKMVRWKLRYAAMFGWGASAVV